MSDPTLPPPPPPPVPPRAMAPPTPLPESAGAPADAGHRPRRRGGAWISIGAGVGILLLAGTAAVSTHIVVSREYDTAAAILLNRVASADEAQRELATARVAVENDVATAATVLDAATASIVSPETRDALQAAVDTATADAQEAAVIETTDIPALPSPVGDQPLWPWELAAFRDAYREDARDAAAAADGFSEVAEQLEGTRTTLGASAGELFSSTASASEKLLADNVSAETGAVIAFRHAAADVTEATALSGLNVDRFTAYAQAADDLRASQKAEMKQKAGPLLKKRLAVEEFARSLSGGVLLDFDWKPIVNGYGWSDSMGGTATWNSADGGFSTITLSNSVAQLWPSARSKALVAHEVGHSISSKCYEMFEWDRSDANEEWATAWAIGQGFTSDANGVQVYGQPRKSMIEKAKACR